VYDVTQYLPVHPGGGDVVEFVGGQDATNKFEEALHSAKSRKEERIFLKGILEGFENDVAALRARGWSEAKGIPYPDMLTSVGAEEKDDWTSGPLWSGSKTRFTHWALSLTLGFGVATALLFFSRQRNDPHRPRGLSKLLLVNKDRWCFFIS